mmetsp:Transcript_5989/g.25048  ORF Transcript_5989/g.25048 Transcript_5989/m.25048 type:complete len:391 (-) Transcript_5989:287-1459(-)
MHDVDDLAAERGGRVRVADALDLCPHGRRLAVGPQRRDVDARGSEGVVGQEARRCPRRLAPDARHRAIDGVAERDRRRADALAQPVDDEAAAPRVVGPCEVGARAQAQAERVVPGVFGGARDAGVDDAVEARAVGFVDLDVVELGLEVLLEAPAVRYEPRVRRILRDAVVPVQVAAAVLAEEGHRRDVRVHYGLDAHEVALDRHVGRGGRPPRRWRSPKRREPPIVVRRRGRREELFAKSPILGLDLAREDEARGLRSASQRRFRPRDGETQRPAAQIGQRDERRGGLGAEARGAQELARSDGPVAREAPRGRREREAGVDGSRARPVPQRRALVARPHRAVSHLTTRAMKSLDRCNVAAPSALARRVDAPSDSVLVRIDPGRHAPGRIL